LTSISFFVVFVVPVSGFNDFYIISCCFRCAWQWFHWILSHFLLCSLCLSMISLTSILFFVVFVVPVSDFIDFYLIFCCFRCACQWFHWLLSHFLLFSLFLSVVSLTSIWFLVVFVVPVSGFIDFNISFCCFRCAWQWFHWLLYNFLLFSLCLSVISFICFAFLVVFVVPASGFIDFYMISCCFRCACQCFHQALYHFVLFLLCMALFSLRVRCICAVPLFLEVFTPLFMLGAGTASDPMWVWGDSGPQHE